MKVRYLLGAATAAISTHAVAQQLPSADQEVVVTGQRAQQERAIQLKREAIGVTDVVASDEIGRLPDRNVAEVVERLPGVGVTHDQGEGRYVAVRGVPSDLNNYTVNGIEIGNPDGLTRALPLDVISGQLLNRIEIAKAKTADMDGQGIGGNINLVTQTAFDFRKPVNLLVNAQVGYQEIDDRNPVRGDASIGARFGPDQQFGILVGASYSDRTYTSYGFYPDDWRPIEGAPRGGLPINTKFTDYRLTRERIGATGSLDFRPSDDQQFYVRGIYSKFTEDEYRQRYRLDFATDALINGSAARVARGIAPGFVINADGVTGTVRDMPAVPAGGGLPALPAASTERRQDLRLEYKEKSVFAAMAGGMTRFGDAKLDYVLARVHNEVREPNQLWQFRCNPGTVDFDFTEKQFAAVPRTECTDAQMQFRQYSEQWETGDEDIWQGKADLTWELPSLQSGSFVKLGAKYRATDKDFDANNDVWVRGTTAATRFTLRQFNLTGRSLSVYPDTDARAFFNGPTIDSAAIVGFTESNLPGPFFLRDASSAATTLQNATLSDFLVEEDVAAAYGTANLKFGLVTVTPGVRFERTNTDITGFRLERGTTVVPDRVRNSYGDWLPSLIARFEPTREIVFRLAYSRSLGRPNYGQLSPGGALAFEDADTDGSFEGSFASGNARLKPYRSDNFDASAEYYFGRGSLLAIGAFAKRVRNPIFTQETLQTDVSFANRQFERLTTTQPLNADEGTIRGIEAAYQQQFTFLPGWLSGLGVELNATVVESTLRLPDGRKSTFPSQSDLLFGGQLFYQKNGFEASIAYHHTGKSLIAVGGEDYQDQYNDDLRRLDAKASFAVLPNLNLFFEAQNLTDEPTRQYQWDRADWLIQNERYGRTYYVGVTARL